MLNTRTGETEVWITRNGIVGEAKALKDGKWQLLPGERYVPGRPSGRFNANGKELNPDAEENMLNAAKGTDWVPISGGVSRNICL